MVQDISEALVTVFNIIEWSDNRIEMHAIN